MIHHVFNFATDESRGLSFDDNLIQSFAKIINRAGHKYERSFRKEKYTDEQMKNLYNWLLTKVDQTKNSVKKYLAVCYYKYDKKKYNEFLESTWSIKNNYKTYKTDRKTGKQEDIYKTIRIVNLKYILKYFATIGKFDEYEELVKKLFTFRKTGTPRALKMNNPEYKSTLRVMDNIRIDSNMAEEGVSKKYSIFRANLLKEIEDLKESRLLKWNDWVKINS